MGEMGVSALWFHVCYCWVVVLLWFGGFFCVVCSWFSSVRMFDWKSKDRACFFVQSLPMMFWDMV